MNNRKSYPELLFNFLFYFITGYVLIFGFDLLFVIMEISTKAMFGTNLPVLPACLLYLLKQKRYWKAAYILGFIGYGITLWILGGKTLGLTSSHD